MPPIIPIPMSAREASSHISSTPTSWTPDRQSNFLTLLMLTTIFYAIICTGLLVLVVCGFRCLESTPEKSNSDAEMAEKITEENDRTRTKIVVQMVVSLMVLVGLGLGVVFVAAERG